MMMMMLRMTEKEDNGREVVVFLFFLVVVVAVPGGKTHYNNVMEYDSCRVQDGQRLAPDLHYLTKRRRIVVGLAA